VIGEGPWIRNPEVAAAFSRSGADSPEFEYELTYDTTGEEYTLGGT
jgi:hypothetical protein